MKINEEVQKKFLKLEKDKLDELLKEVHLKNIDEEVEKQYKRILEMYESK